MVYNLTECAALFFAYAAMGWFMEVLYMGVRERHLTNRGFLLGPCCPIYGAGMLGITLLFQGSHYGYWHVFFSIILLCSLLEYAVSALMERVFHTRWWDYHDMKFNIHGRICLETMLPFGLLGTFALYRINPFLMMLFHRIPGYVSGKLVTGVVVLFLADLVISVCVLRNLSLPDGDADHTAEISRRVWEDLKKRLGDILVAYTYDGAPVYARDIQANGAMTVLLKDAIKPNLVQTLENTPAIMHGGPFANIAHGCNSVRATKTALKLGDYAITEAGFGSDLGAEKFFDIKCRYAELTPACVVLVSTVRSMKYNGGVPKDQLKEENLDALRAGSVNLLAHIENLKKFGVPVVVAINHFYADTQAEIDYVEQICKAAGADFAVTKCFAEGGAGSLELAEKVAAACEKENHFHTLYDLDLPVYEKIEKIAKEVYGADGVDYTKAAKKAIDGFIALGADKLPVCMAKTQYSLSDDPTKLGRPSGFRITVSSASLSAGAGFLVCQTGNVMTMPGLSKSPAAYRIDVDDQGNTVGLF